MLFFLKWEDVHAHSPPIYGRCIKWRNSEDRQLMKWVRIFQLGIFQGGVWWVGIFRVEIFRGGIFLEPSQTFSWAKLSTVNMFSKVPRGEIKKVVNFAFWSNRYWYGLALLLHDIWWIEMLYNSVSFKLRSLKWGGKSFFSYSV